MARLRELDLKKSALDQRDDRLGPSALLALNAKELGEELVQETMSVILKYEADIRKAENEVGKLLDEEGGRRRLAAKSRRPPEAPAPAKKGALH